MDVQVFWNIIGNYNKQTWIIQIILLTFMLLAIMLSYIRKVKWAAKFSLGIASYDQRRRKFCSIYHVGLS